MISSVLFALAVLVILVGWRTIIVPTLVDHYRDQLFDLRREVRDHYLQGRGLGCPEYRVLRDQINSHILYIERVSVFAVAHFLATSEMTTEVSDAYRSTLASRYAQIEGPDYVRAIRSRAAKIVLEFATKSSLTVWAAAIFVAPLVMAVQLYWRLLRQGLAALWALPKTEFARAFVVFLSLVGLQGRFKPSIESVIERAARDYEAGLRTAQHVTT